MRKRKNFSRKSGFRDSKLLVIATEGDKTERQYFLGLKDNYRNPRIHIEVLRRINPANSAPEHVIKLMDRFRKEYRLNKDDKFWIVIDVDRWGEKKLSQIAKQCDQKKYLLAVSNPCFEIWLLLHFIKIEEINCDKCKDKSTILQQLKAILGSFNSSKLDIDDFLKGLDNAIVEAGKLDISSDRWPQKIGTKIYIIVDEIIK